MADKAEVWGQIVWVAKQKHPADHVRARKWALAQFRNLYNEWPYRSFESATPVSPSVPLVNKLHSMKIAYFKSKSRQQFRAGA